MSEFKVGDEVYEVHPFPILRGEIIRLPSKDTHGYYMIGRGPSICPCQELYKSKNEAIDAMIKHLEAMRNE